MTPSREQKPYVIDMSDDETEAWLCFSTEAALSVEKLRGHLREAGIACGIDDDLLADLAEGREPGHRYKIAQAIPPEHGLEFSFALTCEPTPKRLPNGRVDFYNLTMIQNVVKHQILVATIPPEASKPGLTVTGKEITPPETVMSLPQAGANVKLSEDGQALVALVNGHPVLTENVLHVDPTYTHEGDVDFSIGNITCVGNLVITGDVKSGFHVKGAQDVTVHGVVDGGTIEAGGGIYLHGNVFGKQKSHLLSTHTIRGSYVDSATMESQQDIFLTRGARRSVLTAGHRLFVQGKDSSIVGGTARASERIVSYDLGSDREIPTRLEIIPREVDEAASLQLLQQLSRQLKTDVAWLKELLPPPRLSEPFENMKEIVERCYDAIPSLIVYCQKRRQIYAEAAKPFGTIISMGTVHPGVTIAIGRASLLITQPMTNVMFYEEEDTIHVESLDAMDEDGAHVE